MLPILAATAIANMPWTAAIWRESLSKVNVSIVTFDRGPTDANRRIVGISDPRSAGWNCSTAQARVVARAGDPIQSGRLSLTFYRPAQNTFIERRVRYVLLSRPVNKERVMDFDGASQLSGLDLHLRALPEDEEAALLLIPTKATTLPKGLRDADLASAAILDTLNPADDDTYRVAVKLLCRAHPDWKDDGVHQRPYGLPGHILKCPPSPIVSFLKAEIPNARTNYQRSRLWELLVRWHVPGSVKPYFDSLRPLLRDPVAYEEPDDAGPFWGLDQDIGEDMVESDEFFDEPDGQGLSEVLAATNPLITIYWTGCFVGGMKPDQMKRYAELLMWNDPRVQFDVMEVLASQLHDPAHAPKRYGIEGGIVVPYQDLPEKLAYWKKYFGLDR